MKKPPLLRVAPRSTPELDAQWSRVHEVFRAFLISTHPDRVARIGELFECILPWIDRGIRMTVYRHFLLLPADMLVARLFSRTVRLESLPDRYETYMQWVESNILSALNDPNDFLGVVHLAPGEPSPSLQEVFNKLPMHQRASLYLQIMEEKSATRMEQLTEMDARAVGEFIKKQLERISNSFSTKSRFSSGVVLSGEDPQSEGGEKE